MAPDELNIDNNQQKIRAHDNGSKREEVRPVGAMGECDLIIWGRSSWAGEVKN